jgi:hypothetical protein
VLNDIVPHAHAVKLAALILAQVKPGSTTTRHGRKSVFEGVTIHAIATHTLLVQGVCGVVIAAVERFFGVREVIGVLILDQLWGDGCGWRRFSRCNCLVERVLVASGGVRA